MKDFLGYEVGPGDYFCYPLTVGRSACMALYRFVSVNESGNVKACKVEESYGSSYGSASWKYKVFDAKAASGFGSQGAWRDMTEAERAKVDSKTSTLQMFATRAVKIDYKGRAE